MFNQKRDRQGQVYLFNNIIITTIGVYWKDDLQFNIALATKESIVDVQSLFNTKEGNNYKDEDASSHVLTFLKSINLEKLHKKFVSEGNSLNFYFKITNHFNIL